MREPALVTSGLDIGLPLAPLALVGRDACVVVVWQDVFYYYSTAANNLWRRGGKKGRSTDIIASGRVKMG